MGMPCGVLVWCCVVLAGGFVDRHALRHTRPCNPFSTTARALRSARGVSRLGLSGTLASLAQHSEAQSLAPPTHMSSWSSDGGASWRGQASPIGASSGSQSAIAPVSDQLPFWSPLQPPLAPDECLKWKPPQSKPPAAGADDRHMLLQRHEDANQAMADHWGPVSRTVKALEKSHAELLAKNEQLEKSQARLLAEMERLVQTVTVDALARDVARMQPQIQQTGKPGSQRRPGPGPRPGQSGNSNVEETSLSFQ